MSEVLAIKLRTAEGLLSGHDRLPLHHMQRLLSFLRGRRAIEQSLIERLEAEISGEERSRAMRPHAGYQALVRWRREQAARRTGAMTVE